MKGLEISKEYYLTFGKSILEKEFPNILEKAAIGLAGDGSECFGFDDEISTDHDFEPGFCIWLTQKDYTEFGFKLERIYETLPKEYKGLKRQPFSPTSEKRKGVILIDEFYKKFLGTAHAPKTTEHWLSIPSFALANACNGEIFSDKLGEFSKVRNQLLKGYPEDIKLKKIAAHLIMMQQTGLYNYNRCIARKENGAAQLCIFEFVKHTISIIYLLNNKYEPFYKWVYKNMRRLDFGKDLEISLTALTELGNTQIESTAKRESIEEICKVIIKELKNQNLISCIDLNLQKHALSIQNKITDNNLRNMHIMDGI